MPIGRPQVSRRPRGERAMGELEDKGFESAPLQRQSIGPKPAHTLRLSPRHREPTKTVLGCRGCVRRDHPPARIA
ncbi:MAG: hypothetical protein HQ464_01270 [Planctomycetes bacterium]|nr:hypothetical protein [Planctomycetota bacterium]